MSTITMNLYYTGVKGNAQKFAQEMESSGTAAAIRAEEGNLKYNYFISMDDPETVLLIDSWKDQASLDVHHASPMMQTIMQLREKYDLHMRAERYSQENEAVSAADASFIRQSTRQDQYRQESNKGAAAEYFPFAAPF